MHVVSDPSVMWYGGTGHRLLTIEGGVECYRCGMVADDTAWQELVPNCEGPDGGDHYWLGEWASDGSQRIACAYGDAWISPYGEEELAGGRCKRA